VKPARTAPRGSSWVLRVAAFAAGALVVRAVVRAKTRAAERAHPPTGRFVEVDGVRLHVVALGPEDGTPLVLLHGMGVTGAEFLLSALPGLAAGRGYRVLVFDRPGYGWSSRPRGGEPWPPEAQARLVHGALRELCGDRPAIVLGHSWGTLVAVALALEAPQAVRALVLEAGYAFAVPRLEILLLAPLAAPLLGAAWRHTFAPLVLRATWPLVARRMFAPADVPPAFRERFPVWLSLRPSQLRAVGAESLQLMQAAARLERRYREIAVPVAIVAGSGDRIVDPSRHSSRLAREIAKEHLRWIEGVGHMVHQSAPRTVLESIDALVALPHDAPRVGAGRSRG